MSARTLTPSFETASIKRCLHLYDDSWVEEPVLRVETSMYDVLIAELVRDSANLEHHFFLAQENTAFLSNILRVISNDYQFDPETIVPFKRAETEITDTAAFILSLSRAGMFEVPVINDSVFMRFQKDTTDFPITDSRLLNAITMYYNDPVVYADSGYLETSANLREVTSGILALPGKHRELRSGDLFLMTSDLPAILARMKSAPELDPLCREMAHWQRQLIIAIEIRQHSVDRLLNELRAGRKRLLTES